MRERLGSAGAAPDLPHRVRRLGDLASGLQLARQAGRSAHFDSPDLCGSGNVGRGLRSGGQSRPRCRARQGCLALASSGCCLLGARHTRLTRVRASLASRRLAGPGRRPAPVRCAARRLYCRQSSAGSACRRPCMADQRGRMHRQLASIPAAEAPAPCFVATAARPALPAGAAALTRPPRARPPPPLPCRPTCWAVKFDRAAGTLNLEIVLPKAITPGEPPPGLHGSRHRLNRSGARGAAGRRTRLPGATLAPRCWRPLGQLAQTCHCVASAQRLAARGDAVLPTARLHGHRAAAGYRLK